MKINTFFTSDTHYSHANIIKYCNRPFQNINEMNEMMISNHNKMVAQDDIVWYLGDFYMGRDGRAQEYLNRLNGKKHLIIGNHDQVGITLDGWESISDLKEIMINGQKIVLCHYAMRIWNKSHKGSWHLYGHSHGSLPDDPNALSIDVGVDCNNYKPFSMEQIRNIMKKKNWKSIDHHGEK